MDLRLTGKVALVTGGSRGIGKAIAAALAREGCDVALLARNLDAANKTANELAAQSGRKVLAFAADTGNDAAVTAGVVAINAAFGHVDILINAAAQPAGAVKPPGLTDLTEAALSAEINTKVMGYVRTAQQVAPGMMARKWGRIVNISGLAARQSGSAIGSIRNVSVAALTKNLADELGPHGINVTCVHPGLTRTERTAGMIAQRAAKDGVAEAEAERRMSAGNSIRHLVTAEEVADVVAFLASPLSIAINGDAIAVGGGAPGAIYY